MKKVPGKVPIKDEALGPQPVSYLDPTYQTPPKTKHTCELVAFGQVQAGEFHALEHLNVAWGRWRKGEEKRSRFQERFPLRMRPWGLSLFPILTPPTIPHPRPNTPVSFWHTLRFKSVRGMPLNTSMSPGVMG